MEIALLLLSTLLLVSAWAHKVQADLLSKARDDRDEDVGATDQYWWERYEKAEAEWRTRERGLIDQLLKVGGAKPISPQMEVEKVVKLPDPEIPPANFADKLFRQDDILQIVEEMHPEVAGRPWEHVREDYPLLWAKAEAKWELEHTPLRQVAST